MSSSQDSPPTAVKRRGPIPAPRFSRPRYLPAAPFPPYRYVPGVNPHPVRDPAGHSYLAKGADRGRRRPVSGVRRHLVRRAEVVDDWLRGVDLFNAFYFWEAHEAWEGPWRTYPRESAEARMLQGLIQIAAALLKIHLGSCSSARRLAHAGLDKLEHVASRHTNLLGVSVGETTTAFRNYFGPLEERTLPPLDASVPSVLLVDGRRP